MLVLTNTEPPRTFEAAAVVLVRLSIFAFLLLALSRTWVDPDLWGHVRFGGDILEGGLPRVDPYSFASDIGWVNHEWLAEVLMYLAWTVGGGAGLIALKTLIAGATLAIAALVIWRDVHARILRDTLLAAVAIGIWPRLYVMRPQVFSVLLFAAALWLMRSAERGRTRRLLALPVLFALWVNLHGGWIVGLGVLMLWLAASVSSLRASVVSVRWAIFVGALSVTATLINPYGWHMWGFLADTVRFERPMIDDWQPLYRSGAGFILPWSLAAALAAVGLIRRKPPIRASHLVIVLALGAASMRVSRLDAFFALSTVMLLAPQIGGGKTRDTEARPFWNRKSRVAAAAVAFAGATALFAVRQQFTCVSLDVPWMPEREAGVLIARNQLDGRLIAWFGWGQYAIWHSAPRLQVSLDGRRETVYSAAYLDQHMQLYFDPSSALDLLRRLDADYAWLPSGLPLVTELERDGWARLYAGPRSTVLARRGMTAIEAPSPVAPPCFPGP